jgi:hypothetical protein
MAYRTAKAGESAIAARVEIVAHVNACAMTCAPTQLRNSIVKKR